MKRLENRFPTKIMLTVMGLSTSLIIAAKAIGENINSNKLLQISNLNPNLSQISFIDINHEIAVNKNLELSDAINNIRPSVLYLSEKGYESIIHNGNYLIYTTVDGEPKIIDTFDGINQQYGIGYLNKDNIIFSINQPYSEKPSRLFSYDLVSGTREEIILPNENPNPQNNTILDGKDSIVCIANKVDNTLSVFNFENKQEKTIPLENPSRCMFNPNKGSTQMAIISNNNTLQIWDWDNNEINNVYEGSTIFSTIWGREGELIIKATPEDSASVEFIIYDTREKRSSLLNLPANIVAVYPLNIPNGYVIQTPYTADKTGELFLYDSQTGIMSYLGIAPDVAFSNPSDFRIYP